MSLCRTARSSCGGAHLLTLGQSPYRRVGFEEICRVEGCSLSVEAQQRRHLPHTRNCSFSRLNDGRHNELQTEFKKHPERIRLQNPSGVGLLDVAATQDSRRLRSGCSIREPQ